MDGVTVDADALRRGATEDACGARRAEWFAAHPTGPAPALEVPYVPCPICWATVTHDEAGWWCDECRVSWPDVGEAGEVDGRDA